ncbi:hypothetical protein HanPI659440_Chr15g0606801 [Helianthus annuus]|nr:hypothetical protein HanPI659440_Chr15g0606801 [Helianthus annuus]
MASTTSVLLLLFATVIATSTTSATARPCKTIFFITSSSHPNPNNNPPRFTFFLTEIRQFRRSRSLPRPMLFDRSITSSKSSSLALIASDVVTSEPYIASSSTLKASVSERTMDIMSIVGAVIFGVGCGVVTAATMYLFWSLFAPRRFEFCEDEESCDEENDQRVVDDDDDNEGCFGVPVAGKAVPPSADEVDRIAAMK